jgi:hypothetical protein
VFAANGLIELPREGTATMLVTKFSEDPLTLRRGRVVGNAEEPPAVLVVEVDQTVVSLMSSSVESALNDLYLEVTDQERP